MEDRASEFVAEVEKYDKFDDLIDVRALSTIKKRLKSFKQNVAEKKEENRLLRIGIIGQIKRGKSSFLNSVLFEGRDVLPKAATPMTAALTRIVYADENSAEVDFYTKDEWNVIRDNADKARKKKQLEIKAANNPEANISTIDTTQEEESCFELVEMAKKTNLSLDNYLGKTEKISGISNIPDLISKLGNYVGADGKFTPIVKSSTLLINLPELKDIEIVDTPGMNDPIVSRGQATRDFIGKCDVIYFLSITTQFLDVNDMGLLKKTIPSHGINDICLVGSLFDSLLLDEGSKYESVEVAKEALANKLEKQARYNYKKVSEGEDQYMIDTFEKSLPPIFISSMAYNIAKHWDNLNEEEKHIVNELKETFPDDDFTVKELIELGNLKEIDNSLEQVKSEKSRILKESYEKAIEQFYPYITGELEALKKRIERDYKNLKDGNVQKWAEQQTIALKRLEKSEQKVGLVFESHVCDIKAALAKLKNEIKLISHETKKITTKTGTETEAYEVSREVKDSGIWNGIKDWFGCASYHTVYDTRYRTVSYSYVEVHETIENLERFIILAEKKIIESIVDSVDIEKLRKDILSNIKEFIDFEDDNFDPDDILLPVKIAVKRITVPDVSLDCKKHVKIVRDSFTSNTIRDSDVDKLRRKQDEAMSAILSDMSDEINNISEEISSKFKDTANAFIPELTADLKDEIKRVQADLKAGQEKLKRYEALFELLEDDVD